MKKNECIRYMKAHMAKYPVTFNGVHGNEFTVAATREIHIAYRFSTDTLPDIVRLLGADNFSIDVEVADIKEKLLALSEDELFTIGRAPEVDKQVAKYEENRISRLHCILQKVGDEILLINLGHYGTEALRQTAYGLEHMASISEEWPDWLHANGYLTKEEKAAIAKEEAEAYSQAMANRPWWRKLLGMKPATA